MYKFDFITDWNTIWSENFQNKWLDWIESSSKPNVFLHPEFAKVWINTYLPIRNIKPLFCIAKDESGNIIFLPLVLWSKDWKSAFEKAIVPVGYSDYDYSFPIVNGEFNDKFWDELVTVLQQNFGSEYNTIDIKGIREDFISENSVIGVLENSVIGVLNDDICPLIKIEKFNNFEEYINKIKSKERNDIKRQERRLRELGEFEFKIYNSNEKEIALKKLDEILHCHSLKWPNAYKAPSYHKNLINYLLPKKLLHMSEILINGESVCWNISFVYRGVYYFYMPTFVDKFRKYSPGKVNMFLCLKDCFENDFKAFDMLKGAEDYKKKIPTEDMKVYKLKLTNDKLSTKIKKVVLSAKAKIK